MSLLVTTTGAGTTGGAGFISADLPVGGYRELSLDLTLTTLTGGVSPTVNLITKRHAGDGVYYQIDTPTALSAAGAISRGLGAGVGVSPSIGFGDLVQVSVVVTGTQYTVTLGAASAGTFTLTYLGQVGTVQWNSTAAQAQTVLQAVSTLGTHVTCSGTALPTGPLNIQFDASLLINPALMTANFTGLTGATPTLNNPPTVVWSMSVSGK